MISVVIECIECKVHFSALLMWNLNMTSGAGYWQISIDPAFRKHQRSLKAMYGGGIKKLLSFNPKPAAAFVRSEVIRQIRYWGFWTAGGQQIWVCPGSEIISVTYQSVCTVKAMSCALCLMLELIKLKDCYNLHSFTSDIFFCWLWLTPFVCIILS